MSLKYLKVEKKNNEMFSITSSANYKIVRELDLIILVGLVKQLPLLQKRIITQYFWDDINLREISQNYKMSYKVIRKEFVNALDILRSSCQFHNIKQEIAS